MFACLNLIVFCLLHDTIKVLVNHEKGCIMGKKSDEVLDINYDQLADYLHTHHSVYMKVDNDVYYLTDANYEAWRAQDTSLRNAKNHFVDCSELVATVNEFLMLGFINGKTIKDVFSSATFYPSLKGSKDK